jgi:hypothetical protein
MLRAPKDRKWRTSREAQPTDRSPEIQRGDREHGCGQLRGEERPERETVPRQAQGDRRAREGVQGLDQGQPLVTHPPDQDEARGFRKERRAGGDREQNQGGPEPATGEQQGACDEKGGPRHGEDEPQREVDGRGLPLVRGLASRVEKGASQAEGGADRGQADQRPGEREHAEDLDRQPTCQ